MPGLRPLADRVGDDVSTELDVEQGWKIQCWRCTNQGFAAIDQQTPTRDRALELFREVGWQKDADGYQMCPQCWGEP